MQRREYTPTKSSQLHTGHYTGYNRDANKELSIARQFEALKLQAKQLEITNRQLVADADKLRYEKSMNQSKLLQKASFEEEAMAQFQKEKNYQIDLTKAQNEEKLSRLRRQYQNKVEDVQRQISSRELLGRELKDQYTLLERKAQEARTLLEQNQLDLVKLRDKNSNLTEQVTREQFANKKLEMLAEELERQRNEMEEEIHVLLDIEADKSRAIGALEGQLAQTQNSVASLNEKLALLTQNFASLEEHISVMKERLLNAEMRGQDLDNQLQSTELQIRDREGLLAEQKDRQLNLREQIQGHRIREQQRVSEIRQLMADNERIYSDLNAIRFRLYDVSIERGVNV